MKLHVHRSGQAEERKPLLARPFLVMLLVIGLVSAPLGGWALWQDSTSLTPTLRSATVLVPQNVTCTSRSFPLLGLHSAEVKWSPVPGAAKYEVGWIDSQGEFQIITEVTGTDMVFSRGILDGLLGALSDLLLGNSTADIQVRAVHQSTWVSEPSNPVKIVSTSIFGGVLGGIKCV